MGFLEKEQLSSESFIAYFMVDAKIFGCPIKTFESNVYTYLVYVSVRKMKNTLGVRVCQWFSVYICL